jgi:hypothetical protein
LAFGFGRPNTAELGHSRRLGVAHPCELGFAFDLRFPSAS